jgi:hypothetical protein
VPNDYTLASELDHQFGDLPVGLRKILLSMIHGFATHPRAVSAAQLPHFSSRVLQLNVLMTGVATITTNSIIPSMIQLIVRSSLAKGFNFFSNVETRLRNPPMTL